jgi:sulfate permease, SulP family
VAPSVLVYLDNRLFFANAGYVRAASAQATDGAPTPVRWLVFDAEALTHVDATGVDALAELIRSLQREGSRSCSPASRARCAKPSATPGSSGAVGDHLYPTVRSAVQAAASGGAPRAGRC